MNLFIKLSDLSEILVDNLYVINQGETVGFIFEIIKIPENRILITNDNIVIARLRYNEGEDNLILEYL